MGDPVTLGLSGIGAASSAFNLLKGFVDLRDAAKVQALKFELMGLLLEAQVAQSTLIAEKRQLEERVRQLEAWDREKERYELVEVAAGVVAYALKAEAKGSEPDHKLCPTCFLQGRASPLQPEQRVPGMHRFLVCHACGTDLVISGFRDARSPSPGKGRR